MAFRKTVLLLALGEGYAEEGERFLRPGTPGDPIPDGDRGALHILVGRILAEKTTLQPVLIWPPRIRSGRRQGNPGLLCDIAGLPRHETGTAPNAPPRQKPIAPHRWLDFCVGRNRVDLAVVVKDCGRPGWGDRTRQDIRKVVGSSARDLDVVVGSAEPSIEAWLLPIPETDGLDEKAAKQRWHSAGHSLRPGPDYVRRAREVDLDVVAAACPDGFGKLLADLIAWADAIGAPPADGSGRDET